MMYHILSNGSNDDLFSQIYVYDTDINDEQISILKGLLLKYSSCFRPTPRQTALVQHYIDTGNTLPIKLRPYRVPPPHRPVISSEIAKMLAADIVETTNSPYAAPVTLQLKKDGNLRFCIDSRELNAVTVRDAYPIPQIDDTLHQLHFSKYSTSLDLKSGF